MNPLFRPGALFGHATPHGDATPARVSVKRAYRDRAVDGLAFEPDARTAAHIRAHLPNAGSPSAELRACRVAAVLDKQAAFLADRTGTVEPPERFEVVEACQFAAEFIRDRIVVGVRR